MAMLVEVFVLIDIVIEIGLGRLHRIQELDRIGNIDLGDNAHAFKLLNGRRRRRLDPDLLGNQRDSEANVGNPNTVARKDDAKTRIRDTVLRADIAPDAVAGGVFLLSHRGIHDGNLVNIIIDTGDGILLVKEIELGFVVLDAERIQLIDEPRLPDDVFGEALSRTILAKDDGLDIGRPAFDLELDAIRVLGSGLGCFSFRDNLGIRKLQSFDGIHALSILVTEPLGLVGKGRFHDKRIQRLTLLKEVIHLGSQFDFDVELVSRLDFSTINGARSNHPFLTKIFG